MSLVILSCAWLAGIFLGYRFALPPWLALLALLPLPLLLLRRRKRAVVLASLALAALFTAAPYSYAALNTFDSHDLRFYNGTGAVEMRGMVASDPDTRDSVTHLRFSASEIRLEEEWRTIEGTALLYVPHYPEFRYGDMLQIEGLPDEPPEFEDFDYRNYLAHQGIYTTLTYPEIEVQERDRGFGPIAWLYSLWDGMSRVLARILPEPQSSLARAIVLGQRGMLPQHLKDDFTQTGTAHLLAISGLHLGIVAGIMLSLGSRLVGRRHYLHIWLSLATIWLYAMLTGMHPPVVRGAIMASMFLIAGMAGRQRSAINALLLAAALMVGFRRRGKPARTPIRGGHGQAGSKT